jgi:hypothetical protein
MGTTDIIHMLIPPTYPPLDFIDIIIILELMQIHLTTTIRPF